VFESLADIVRQSPTSPELYAAICIAATLEVPECDHASLMIRRDGAFSTVGVSDPIARKVDALELALQSGPCIDAIEKKTAQLESDLTVGDRWPALSARVVAETPVRGAISVRLPIDRNKAGALNLFSDRRDAFDHAALQRALVVAAFATVAANAAAHGEDVATLRRGLISNRAIGKAIGMLMVRNEVSDEDAFEILRRISQATNVKLADVAADVVERGALPDQIA
jgi:hypothetical protein